MSELPKGWVGINLDKICDIIRGVTYKKEDAIDYSKMGYIPLYRALFPLRVGEYFHSA